MAGLGYLRLSLWLKSCWHLQLFFAGCISEGSPPALLAKLEGKTHLGCFKAEQGSIPGVSAGCVLDLGAEVVSRVAAVQECRSRAGVSFQPQGELPGCA